MSTLNAYSKRDEPVIGASSSLFTEKTSEQLFPEQGDDHAPSNGKHMDPTEEAYNEPIGRRETISKSTHDKPDEKRELYGQAISPEESKRRTQYFEEKFQYKDTQTGSVRERIHRDAPIIAELRTNVIVSVVPISLPDFPTNWRRSRTNSLS